jgi:hypothetical protein
MIVAVQGTKEFNDYNVFLRAMSVAMSGMKAGDNDFIIYSAGPLKVNNFVSEFSNLSERGMKARGKKIKFYNVAPIWLGENINQINYFVFLSRPKETKSKLVLIAEANNIDVGLFKY